MRDERDKNIHSSITQMQQCSHFGGESNKRASKQASQVRAVTFRLFFHSPLLVLLSLLFLFFFSPPPPPPHPHLPPNPPSHLPSPSHRHRQHHLYRQVLSEGS